MRVLWFANTPSRYTAPGSKYNGYGWVASLEEEIAGRVSLSVAFTTAGPLARTDGRRGKVAWQKEEQNGVTYYLIDNGYEASRRDRMRFLLSGRRQRLKEEAVLVDAFTDIVRDAAPDFIEVFGSEHAFGLVAGKTDIPVVLHVQGILGPYRQAYLPPAVPKWRFLLTPPAPGAFLHRLFTLKQWRWKCDRERRIHAVVRNYLVRTDWDRAETLKMQPQARLFHGGEILRPPFYKTYQDAYTKHPFTPDYLLLVTTISEAPYKGTDLLLRTGKLLREKGLKFRWYVFGNVSPALFEKSVGITEEEAGLEFLGVTDWHGIVTALRPREGHRSVYVHPSYIENSSNSICEAQILGAPVVACRVGGTPSLIEDGVTGLMVPAGDAEAMAAAILSLAWDPDKCAALAGAAREAALVRHDKERIVAELIHVYETLHG